MNESRLSFILIIIVVVVRIALHNFLVSYFRVFFHSATSTVFDVVQNTKGLPRNMYILLPRVVLTPYSCVSTFHHCKSPKPNVVVVYLYLFLSLFATFFFVCRFSDCFIEILLRLVRFIYTRRKDNI